jgi:hypothetical protein
MKKLLALVAAIALCAVGTVYAISFGGPGGEWPETWPKELEPLRKQAWTWQHGDSRQVSYDIPFTSREEFEAAWPHILSIKGEAATITLLRGDHLRVDKGGTAGVFIAPQRPGIDKQTLIRLVVDGEIVDLNRIPFPPDTPIIDERFEDEKAKQP